MQEYKLEDFFPFLSCFMALKEKLIQEDASISSSWQLENENKI